MRVDRAVIVIGMTGLGIIMAYILETMNAKGILIDEMVTGSITINDLMMVVIFFFMLTGVIWGAIKR